MIDSATSAPGLDPALESAVADLTAEFEKIKLSSPPPLSKTPGALSLLGEKVHAYLVSGNGVPDLLMCELIAHCINALPADNAGWIITVLYPPIIFTPSQP